MKRLIESVAMAALAAFIILVVPGLLAACGDKPASFDTLEQERGTARQNAMFNAQVYRPTNPLFSGWDIVGRGDSSQTADCPMGDGWATMDFVSPDRTKVVQVMCSTVSANLGCLVKADFKNKSYASEDGQCQKGKLPSPLPKINK